MALNFSSPLIMGILNATPDSYYAASRITHLRELEKQITTMLNNGMDILDIGGQSTRPGAEQISSLEEWKRIGTIIEFIRLNFPELKLSVDTFYSDIAQKALDLGVVIINDVYAGRASTEIFDVCQRYHAHYVLMHSRGNASTMNSLAEYSNVVEDVKKFFLEELLQRQVKPNSKLILDPGFGFAKNTEQNFELLNALGQFKDFNFPILVGISRKKMIQNTLNCDANHALNGSTALHFAALERGAKILRVHDVKEAKECIQLFLALNR
jgi:dihydropteroate synthase